MLYIQLLVSMSTKTLLTKQLGKDILRIQNKTVSFAAMDGGAFNIEPVHKAKLLELITLLKVRKFRNFSAVPIPHIRTVYFADIDDLPSNIDLATIIQMTVRFINHTILTSIISQNKVRMLVPKDIIVFK